MRETTSSDPKRRAIAIEGPLVENLTNLVTASVFQDVSAVQLGLLAAVVFVSFFIKGAVGIGSLTPMVLFSALILDPHRAVLLALAVNVASQVQFLPTALRDGDWSVARQVIPANFAGAVVGIWVFGRVESGTLGLILGLVLGVLVILDLSGAVDRFGERRDLSAPPMVWSLSGLAGLISGVTGAGGLLFLTLYLRVVCPDRTTLRGTILLLSVLVVFWRLIVLTAAGFMDLTLLAEGLLMVPLVVLGGVVGATLFRHMSEGWFAHALRAIVLVGAGGLIWDGASRLL